MKKIGYIFYYGNIDCLLIQDEEDLYLEVVDFSLTQEEIIKQKGFELDKSSNKYIKKLDNFSLHLSKENPSDKYILSNEGYSFASPEYFPIKQRKKNSF